jgi:hypothetical protein
VRKKIFFFQARAKILNDNGYICTPLQASKMLTICLFFKYYKMSMSVRQQIFSACSASVDVFLPHAQHA